jgi:serine phosphatase RsbU (regulator of sigma subunit)/integral membrane sensor domain MASE1
MLGAMKHSPRLLGDLRLFLAVAVAYAIGAELSWQSFGASSSIAFFPPAGITLAALLLVPRRRWPVVLVAAALAEALVDIRHGLTLTLSIGYAAANVVEPVIGALVIQRLRPERLDLRRRADAGVFLVGGCVAGPLAGALIGATTKMAAVESGNWFVFVGKWWVGDGVAVLAVGSVLLLLWRRPLALPRPAELAIGAAATVAGTVVTFMWQLPPAMFALPVLIWAAIRLGVEGVAVIGALFAMTANYMTAIDQGLLVAMDASSGVRLAVTQGLIAGILLSGWALAIEINERVIAQGAEFRAQYERDRASTVAAVMQLAVQPEIPSHVPNFDVAGIYEPASVAGIGGGDWFDVIVVSDDRVAFVVGDVVGHGVEAIEDMVQLRFAARALAWELDSPADLLTHLDALATAMTHGKYATGIIAFFDPSTRTLTHANAGHPPLAMWRALDSSAELLPTTAGLPLGLGQGVYCNRETTIGRGDLLVLYSDGLVETRSCSIDVGLQSLLEAVASEAATAEGAELQSACRRIVDRCRNGNVPTDDICLLAVRAH